MTRRHIPFALIAVVAAIALAPSQASAATTTFRNSSDIAIPGSGPASPSPSTLSVSGMKGPVTGIEVSLEGVSHTRPDDLDVLLVAPDGTRTILMSDACGDTDVSDRTWIFKSDGVLVPAMADALSCPSTYYIDTNYGGGDVWPGAPANPDSTFKSLHRKVMNGQWKVFVVDDAGGESGTIHGWSLTLTTGPVDTMIPGTGTFGVADPYPVTRTVDRPGADKVVITDLDVTVPLISHDRPDDLELLLVGPQGQRVLLMSDACGSARLVNNDLTFNDEGGPLPDGENPFACLGDVKPTDYEPGENLPGAPSRPYSSSLDVFDFTEPSGDWKLYANDDTDGGDGYLLEPFYFVAETRPKAAVELTEATVQVAEGGTRALTIRRSADGGLGAASVKVTTAPGTAASGGDYSPLATTAQFGPDEREKTIQVDALSDGAAEPAESYSVALSDPTGDSALGGQTRAEVTIPAPTAAGPVQAAPRCAGKRATIVGTARRDVLRGTRRADVIVALGGNDTVKAARGNDVVCAGTGNDRVLGESGRDRLYGGTGRDRLFGAGGNDRLTGDRGRDTCLGGRGRDRIKCERWR